MPSLVRIICAGLGLKIVSFFPPFIEASLGVVVLSIVWQSFFVLSISTLEIASHISSLCLKKDNVGGIYHLVGPLQPKHKILGFALDEVK